MGRSWSFGQKIGFGFAAIVALTVLTGAIAVYALRTVVASMTDISTVHAQNLVQVKTLGVSASQKSSALRGYLLSKEERHLEEMRDRRASFHATLSRLREQIRADVGRQHLDRVERLEAEHQSAADRVIAQRLSDAPIDTVARAFETEVHPERDALVQALDGFSSYLEQVLQQAKQAATDRASLAVTLVFVVAIAAAILAIVLALFLTRALKRQIGAAVQHIQSSSAELQSAANQQASGAKEQATAMNEITVTVQELLTTAKQIAESAQRVAKIAEDAAASAHSGDQTVQKTQDAVSGIKRQVDLIVSHMLDLGKKSQQIGSVLEIVNELAEQTNILAINATIEAAGAGELGKRFAAVADEIRKLADRVGSSTKEIRTLIEEIHAAVHTTVMATETGSKAVEVGMKQFGDVASAFKQIVGMVGTTTEAAREIELSTKHQSTAVEQVNFATADVAQAVKESEASSLQTVQTASDLAKLSHDLALLIQPQARA